MVLQEAIAKLQAIEAGRHALGHAMSILFVDGETAAPKNSYKGRGDTLAYLSGESYKLLVNPETKEIVDTILADSSCDQKIRRQAELMKEDYDELTRIPMEEFVAYQQLTNESSAVWHEAKEKNDYAAFAPYLEKLIDTQRRFAGYKDAARAPYDVMLDNYEKGMSIETVDPFFALLREKLTPVIHAVKEAPAPRTDFLHRVYPIAQQRVFSDRLMDMMGIDRNRCTIGETEHPFTDGVNKWDVRITTHYYENDVANSMYSVIHEGGHALYELGVADDLQFTCLAGGSTMGLHESQSRFYENLIGRSEAFCDALYPVMRELFPQQMADVTAEELYRGVNMATPSLIRTEADELTYAMHVMIRYEMEKRMIAGDVKVADLHAMWNELYQKYLGVTVPNDRQGILQDSHWSGGSFGYFPSYALGSAYGVQMLSAMKQTVDVEGCIRAGDMAPITDWLGEKIHRYGRLLTPQELLRDAIGGDFDPNCYVDYLTDKYTKLYHL